MSILDKLVGGLPSSRHVIGSYKGEILDGGKVYSPKFKVYIQELLPLVAGGSPLDEPISVNKGVLVSDNPSVTGTINTSNYWEADNHTYYTRRFHFGDVFEMAASEGITEFEYLPWGCQWSGAPHGTNIHEILKPLKFFKMKFENLNDVDCAPGDVCMVTLYDISSAGVTHIPDVIEK